MNVPCEFKSKVHLVVLRNSQEISIISNSFDDAVKFSCVFTGFSLLDLCISDRRVLKDSMSLCRLHACMFSKDKSDVVLIFAPL